MNTMVALFLVAFLLTTSRGVVSDALSPVLPPCRCRWQSSPMITIMITANNRILHQQHQPSRTLPFETTMVVPTTTAAISSSSRTALFGLSSASDTTTQNQDDGPATDGILLLADDDNYMDDDDDDALLQVILQQSALWKQQPSSSYSSTTPIGIINNTSTTTSSTCTDAMRLLHGRGGCWPGWEHVTVDWYPPVVLLTTFGDDQAFLSTQRQMRSYARQLEQAVTLLQLRRPAAGCDNTTTTTQPQNSTSFSSLSLNLVHQHRYNSGGNSSSGAKTTVTRLVTGSVPDPHMVTEQGAR